MADPTAIVDTIGDSISEFGGFLRCETCGTRQALGHVGFKLAGGWPTCCGYTMRWWTQRQIDADEVPPCGSGGTDQ